jgi:hypothetical protein
MNTCAYELRGVHWDGRLRSQWQSFRASDRQDVVRTAPFESDEALLRTSRGHEGRRGQQDEARLSPLWRSSRLRADRSCGRVKGRTVPAVSAAKPRGFWGRARGAARFPGESKGAGRLPAALCASPLRPRNSARARAARGRPNPAVRRHTAPAVHSRALFPACAAGIGISLVPVARTLPRGWSPIVVARVAPYQRRLQQRERQPCERPTAVRDPETPAGRPAVKTSVAADEPAQGGRAQDACLFLRSRVQQAGAPQAAQSPGSPGGQTVYVRRV